MLKLSDTIRNIAILSLRTGSSVATTTAPIINPINLKIEGFYCNDNYSGDALILLTQDIREQLPEGFVINDHEVLVSADELVRMKKLISAAFELHNKPVVTLSGDRVGKVGDFALESESFFIQKLYVSQPLIKSLTAGSLVVDRTQIQEITNKKIIIDDLLDGNRLRAIARP